VAAARSPNAQAVTDVVGGDRDRRPGRTGGVTVVDMAVVKKTVSFDPEVWADVQKTAVRERIGASTVVNRALRHDLRIQRGLAAVAEWEGEHESFSEQELADADAVLDDAGVGADDQLAPADVR
jgi:hypothetical protein